MHNSAYLGEIFFASSAHDLSHHPLSCNVPVFVTFTIGVALFSTRLLSLVHRRTAPASTASMLSRMSARGCGGKRRKNHCQSAHCTMYSIPSCLTELSPHPNSSICFYLVGVWDGRCRCATCPVRGSALRHFVRQRRSWTRRESCRMFYPCRQTERKGVCAMRWSQSVPPVCAPSLGREP